MSVKNENRFRSREAIYLLFLQKGSIVGKVVLVILTLHETFYFLDIFLKININRGPNTPKNLTFCF